MGLRNYLHRIPSSPDHAGTVNVVVCDLRHGDSSESGPCGQDKLRRKAAMGAL